MRPPEEITLTRRRVALALAPGIGLGLALTLAWLALWHLLIDAANLFPLAAAFICLGGWFLSAVPLLRRSGKRSIVRVGAATLSWAAAALAAEASLSVGALMPAWLAEWASPVLGRFGGQWAPAVLAVGLVVAALAGLARWCSLLLDAIMACGLASWWIGSEVELQAAFPPPPTTAALLTARFDALFWLGLLFALLPVLGWLASYVLRSLRLPAPPILLARWLWRWAGLLAVLGLIGGLALDPGGSGWYRFGLLGLGTLAGSLIVPPVASGNVKVADTMPVARGGVTTEAQDKTGRRASIGVRKALAGCARATGWLLLALVASALLYFTTGEDLEVVMLRNMVERQAMQLWRGEAWVAGNEQLLSPPAGSLAGTVRDDAGRPLTGAAVVVSTASGQAYSAYSGPDGRYFLDGVPQGNYLPMAVAPGYRQAPPSTWAGRVATVRPSQTTRGVDFRLQPQAAIEPYRDESLHLDPPTIASADNPEPSKAVRRSFTFRNGNMLLTGGLVHEPPAEMGPGPFPILLIIYPGEARFWEGVSIPLAAKGYVVVSYFPVRLTDLQGDLDDLMVLLGSVAEGRLSARGDTNRIVLVGGSVSTVYTYLMAREIEGSQVRQQITAAIQYGGLFDFFAYRHDWECGRIVIDPGISGLEYLLIAFGRPDTRPELYLFFSPRYSLGAQSLPPTLLVHAGKDIIVPVNQSRIADQRLNELGITHRLLLYLDIEHYLDTSKRDPAQVDMLEQTVTFLEAYAK